MAKKALVFPGQGSQTVGMGAQLADRYREASEVFAQVDDVLDQKLSELIWHGPQQELMLTKNTQPALMAVSMAVLAVMRSHGINPATMIDFVAGHSLGEYSALVASGALSLSDAAKLLKIRGKAMQRAVPVGEGAMVAVLGLDAASITELLTGHDSIGVCEVANDNASSQVVISGDVRALERAVLLIKANGARRVVRLAVSAPFHCSLMAPAARVMAEALREVKINPPEMPIITNVGAKPVSDPEQLRSSLVAQVTGLVRWRETTNVLATLGVDLLFEVGAGKVLTGLARKSETNLRCYSVNGIDDIKQAVSLCAT